MTTDTQLQAFCAEAQKKVTAAGRSCTLIFKRGPRYAKIIETEQHLYGGSVFCFVDLATGDILKAKSWNGPVKGARGNIANGAADITPYGAAYLR
jgi:hypothetical protein